MTRTPLPNLRHGVRLPVTFQNLDRSETVVTILFNLDDGGVVRECFLAAGAASDENGPGRDKISKTGTTFRAILEDGCRAISRLLQYGDTCADLAAYFGEDRPEGADSGTPSSILGAIARAGVELDKRALEIVHER